jgi:hypothetical protein
MKKGWNLELFDIGQKGLKDIRFAGGLYEDISMIL